MSHVTHTNESCHTWSDSSGRPELTSIFSVSIYINKSCHRYEWVMSHTWMSHVTHMNELCIYSVSVYIDESCHTYEWVWYLPCRCVYMNESCPTYEWMPHIWMSHVPPINEACPTYEWVMSHIWMSHVPHMNESCPTYEWVMSHIWKRCPTYERAWDLFHECIYGWVMSHMWLVMSHIWWSHFTNGKESCHTYEWVMSHTNETCHTYEIVMSHMIWFLRISSQIHFYLSFKCIHEWVMSHI